MTITIVTNDSIRRPCGGLGVYLQETLKRFPSNYRFLVLGPNTDEAHYGSNYLYVPSASMSTIPQAAQILSESSVIHAMDGSTFETALQLKARLGKPLIAHIHLSEPLLAADMARYSGIHGWDPARNAMFEKRGLASADHIIHVSNAYARRFPATNKPVSVVWNGINAQDFPQAANQTFRLPGPSSNRKLLYIGRLTYQKGLQNLIKTTLPPNINLYLVGGVGAGNEPELVMRVIEWTTRNPNAFYLGSIWGEQKLSILQQCDAQLMPSIHEPFGIVGLEAVASNNLVISSFADGMQDFLRPEYALDCGFSPSSVQNALNYYASMPAAQIAQMKAKARSILPYFTWEAAVDKLRTIYSSVHNSRNPQHYELSQLTPQKARF